MNDLISRKALLKEMIDFCGCVSYLEGKNGRTIYIDELINNQPTAYDVNKVLERLEDCKCSEEDANREESIYMRNAHIQMCINVVKGAIINE